MAMLANVTVLSVSLGGVSQIFLGFDTVVAITHQQDMPTPTQSQGSPVRGLSVLHGAVPNESPFKLAILLPAQQGHPCLLLLRLRLLC